MTVLLTSRGCREDQRRQYTLYGARYNTSLVKCKALVIEMPDFGNWHRKALHNLSKVTELFSEGDGLQSLQIPWLQVQHA